MFSSPEETELLWSANSKILVIQCGGKIHAYLDLNRGKAESLPSAFLNSGSEESAEQTAWRDKVQALLNEEK